MSLIDDLTPKLPKPQPFVRTRRVPVQPGSVPGKVYLGSDIGFVDYQGPKPRPGDLAHVTGTPGRFVATSGQALPSLVQPIFSGEACKCKCPASTNGGQIFFQTQCQFCPNLIVVDGRTGAIALFDTPADVVWPAGIGVDRSAPYDLFVLDDRTATRQIEADGITRDDPTINWFTLLKYSLSGGTYSLAAAKVLPGGEDDDEPGWESSNALAVFNGVCWITMNDSPAHILKWSGGDVTTINLTLADEPYNGGLIGQVVRVADKPGRRDKFFVIGFRADVELLQFNSDGAISSVLTLTDMEFPRALVTVCNRLYVVQASAVGRGIPGEPPEEDDDDDEGGGGGEEQ